MEVVRINELDEIFKYLISEQKYDERINRYRSSYIYRGLSNGDYSLVTTLARNCKDKQRELEKPILRNFYKYASEHRIIQSSDWHKMIVGQHHGLPTRLMDWTYSPLVALHFAMSEGNLNDIDKHDCVVWQIDIEELNSLLPEKYIQALSDDNAYLFTVDTLSRVAGSIEEYDNDMSDKAMVLLEPPSIDPRIVNQYSHFSVVPMQMTKVEDFLNDRTVNTVKYIIAKEIRWRIRDMLEQMNINERTLLPGLDGLASWLRRHYFVK